MIAVTASSVACSRVLLLMIVFAVGCGPLPFPCEVFAAFVTLYVAFYYLCVYFFLLRLFLLPHLLFLRLAFYLTWGFPFPGDIFPSLVVSAFLM